MYFRIICGLTGFTTKNHIIRAALEAVCFQTRDILEAMNQDCEFNLNKLKVDGVLTANTTLMQLQADLSGIPVCKHAIILKFCKNKTVLLYKLILLSTVKSHHTDTTALGVAMAAAQADGIDAFTLNTESRFHEHAQHDTYLPTTTDAERNIRYSKWKMAVQRSLGWSVTKKSEAMTDERFRLLASVPGSLFLMSSFAMLAYSKLTSQPVL